MDSTLFVSLTAVLSTFCVIAGGFVLRRTEVLNRESDRGLMKMMINFLMPCLILDRILPNDIFADWSNLYYPPLLGFGVIAFGIAIAALVGFLPKSWTGLDSRKKVGTFAACVGIYNYGFVPIPLIQLLFGDKDPTMGVLFVQNLGVEFALWTVGLLAIQGGFSRDSWKHAINGPTITILLAIPLNLLLHSRAFPDSLSGILEYFNFLAEAVRLLGQAAVPLSMILIGASIADHFRWDRYKNHFRSTMKITFWSCFLRLLVLPIFIVAIAVFLPCSLELKRVLVLHAAMGSAVFPIVMTQHYGGDSQTALDSVLSNSLLSLITIPLWVSLGLNLIGS